MRRSGSLALLALVVVGHALRASEKRIVVEKYGFSIEPPKGWRVGIRETDGLPIFANAAWSKYGQQFWLPKGGATIHIIAQEGLPGRVQDYTIEKWLEFGQVISKAGTASSRIFDMPTATGITRALLTTFDEATFVPDDQPHRSVVIYWEFRGKRFAMYLAYVVGDPRGKRYEDLLIGAAQSIRSIK